MRSKNLRLVAYAFAATSLVVVGCSSAAGTAPPAPSAASPSPAPRPADVHRASANACAARSPSATPVTGGEASSGCRSDADCTKGLNGRCQGTGLGVVACTYDACVTDADCGGRAFCDCRATEGLAPNRCVTSFDCHVDADCGPKDYCSPSWTPDGVGGSSLAFQGYFCHTSQDECVNDADCASAASFAGGSTCDFDPGRAVWRCSHRSGVSE